MIITLVYKLVKRKAMRKKILWVCFMFLGFCLAAQNLPMDLSTESTIYSNDIKSVKIYTDDIENPLFSIPIITLNSGEYFTLEFDDLAEEPSRYIKYTLIHCTHDWQISELNQLEYLDGFGEDEIRDFEYGFNTIQKYMKYSLTFPTEYLRPKVSGNYLLLVYDNDPSQLLLSRRILFQESMPMGVTGHVTAAQDVAIRETHQQVDFTVYTGNYNVRNPAMYLHATIIQNGRWDNAITGLTYYTTKPGELGFNFATLNKNVFSGGAEFRVFDTRSLKYNSTGIASIGYKADTNIAMVLEDIAKPYTAYSASLANLYGSTIWENVDMDNENTEDYVKVNFSLRNDLMVEGDLYVFGELTDWRIIPEAKLQYNPATNYWETALYLKQGVYNYQYVHVPKRTHSIDATYIEGSHWQTRNEYSILIYLRDEGTSIDRLVGSLKTVINP